MNLKERYKAHKERSQKDNEIDREQRESEKVLKIAQVKAVLANIEGAKLIDTNGYVYDIEDDERVYKLCDQDSRAVGESHLKDADPEIVKIANDSFLGEQNSLFIEAVDIVQKRHYCTNGVPFLMAVQMIVSGNYKGEVARY